MKGRIAVWMAVGGLWLSGCVAGLDGLDELDEEIACSFGSLFEGLGSTLSGPSQPLTGTMDLADAEAACSRCTDGVVIEGGTLELAVALYYFGENPDLRLEGSPDLELEHVEAIASCDEETWARHLDLHFAAEGSVELTVWEGQRRVDSLAFEVRRPAALVLQSVDENGDWVELDDGAVLDVTGDGLPLQALVTDAIGQALDPLDLIQWTYADPIVLAWGDTLFPQAVGETSLTVQVGALRRQIRLRVTEVPEQAPVSGN